MYYVCHMIDQLRAKRLVGLTCQEFMRDSDPKRMAERLTAQMGVTVTKKQVEDLIATPEIYSRLAEMISVETQAMHATVEWLKVQLQGLAVDAMEKGKRGEALSALKALGQVFSDERKGQAAPQGSSKQRGSASLEDRMKGLELPFEV